MGSLLIKISKNLNLKTKDMNTENVKSENSKLLIPNVSGSLPLKDYEERIDDYVEEQYKLNNIEEYEKSWMTAIIIYWYHQGQISNDR